MEEIANLADSKDQILKHKDNLEMQQLRVGIAYSQPVISTIHLHVVRN